MNLRLGNLGFGVMRCPGTAFEAKKVETSVGVSCYTVVIMGVQFIFAVL